MVWSQCALVPSHHPGPKPCYGFFKTSTHAWIRGPLQPFITRFYHLPHSQPPTVLTQAPYAVRGTALSPAGPVPPLSHPCLASLPHQTHLPQPGAWGSPLPGSTQSMRTNLCHLLPTLPCYQPGWLYPPPRSTLCHAPTWHKPLPCKHTPIIFLLLFSPRALLYQSPSPILAVCHPALSDIPQPWQGYEGTDVAHILMPARRYSAERWPFLRCSRAEPAPSAEGCGKQPGHTCPKPGGCNCLSRSCDPPQAGSYLSPHFL